MESATADATKREVARGISAWPRGGLFRGLLSLACAAAASLLPAPASAQSSACPATRFDGANYTVCTFDARRNDIQMFWKGADGRPYGAFAPLAAALNARGRELRFAMNAGIFEADATPVGLYIEDDKQLRKPNLRDGDSNFYLKPNGVFFVGDGNVGVMETSRFVASAPQARYATQSGPMLVIEGEIHPRILVTGTSAKTRNGVGVRGGSTAIFAISDEPVTFYAFARLFRDALKCPNALYLDGSISSLFSAGLKRDDALWPIGPIIAVTAPSPAH
jgi:uncharacterized protein YigE (DUF2233 family)